MSEPKKLTLPLLNTSVFAMISMTLLIAIAISLFLYKEYSLTLNNQQKEYSERQSNISKDAILKTVNNYETILKDFANFPLLRLAVMQPDNSLEDAVDMMKSFSFLGEKYPLAICDFEGRPLYDFFASQPATQVVFSNLKTNPTFELKKVVNIEEENFLLLAAPITVRNSNEGAICILVPVQDLVKNSLSNTDSMMHYEIFKGAELIHKSTIEKKSFLETSIILFDDIKLSTYLDPSPLKNAQNSLFKKLLMSIIVIITLISFLTFMIINKFLLKPIVSLCDMTYSVTKNQQEPPSAIDSPIKEITMLKEDIMTMISTLNQRSDELNSANSELEERVKIRTMELEQKAEELEQLSKYKSEFLARMSHEIRTPMNAIVGFTDILKETSLQAEQMNHLKIISSSADALLTVINDILDFSKIEAGMMTIEKIPFDIDKVMNEIKHLFTKNADDKGLNFEVSMASGQNSWFSGDPHRIRQILINLTGNAIKFTNQGSVIVKAETEVLKNNKTKLDIIVEDTGIGIPQNKLEDVFNSFSQAEGSVSRQYGGTGLGLPISKELAELMGGSLSVYSKEGKGTTFRFSVLLDTAKAVKNETRETLIISWSRSPKILLVEDNLVNMKLAEKTLKSFDVEFTSCDRGQKAIDIIEQNCTFDLVLMDCQMPEMDGMETTRRIRKIQQAEGMPIIAFTANALDDEIKECYESGMNDYISKPFKKEIFSEKLRKWLKHLIDDENSETKAS